MTAHNQSHVDPFAAAGTSPPSKYATSTFTSRDPASPPDVVIDRHGTLTLLRPYTAPGLVRLQDYLADGSLYWGDAAVVEPRYVLPIVDGMLADGLETC